MDNFYYCIKAGSAGKGSEELFGSEPNYSAVLSPHPELNQVETYR